MKKFNIELSEEQFAEIQKIAEFDGRGIKNQCEKFISVMINLYKNNVTSYSNTEINLYNESKTTSIQTLKNVSEFTRKVGEEMDKLIEPKKEQQKRVVIFKKPTIEEIYAYMVSISYPNATEESVKFFKNYDPEWIDSNNKPVKNWKGKVKYWLSLRSSEPKDFMLNDFEEQILDKYSEVYLSVYGNEPNIDASEKKAAKELVNYLVSESEKSGKPKENAIDSIRLIVSNVDLWGEMYNKKVSISHILKHINQIIINIKKYTAHFKGNIEVMKQINPNYAMNNEDRKKWIAEFNSKNK